MPQTDFGGFPSAASYSNHSGTPGDIAYRDYSWSPTLNQAANGNYPIRIDGCQGVIASGSGVAQVTYQGVTTSGPAVFGNAGGTVQARLARTGGDMYIGTNPGGGGSWAWALGGGGAGTLPFRVYYGGVPSAPALTNAVQASPVSASLTWSAPADVGGFGVTGYRIVYSTDPTFATSTTLDVGNVLTAVVAGLTPGVTYYFKVAAINDVASAASTSSLYSSSASVLLVATVGDLDGWSPYGSLPSGLTPLVGAGLRRGGVYPVAGAPVGLIREIQRTGSGGPTTAAALGIERTITGLKIGATYKLSGTMLSLNDTPPSGVQYRWAVTGIGAGANGTISNTSSPVAIPDYTFVATATMHVIRIQLNHAVSWSGSGWFENVAFYGIALTEIPNLSPYRLQDTAYEGPLSNHFTYACDTLGAAWWVDRANVTQFRQADSQDALKATFTDKRATGKLEYVDISASYDTRNVVNLLAVNNHGRNATTGNAADLTYAASDPASVTAWGPRSGSTDWTLYTQPPTTNLMQNPSATVNDTGWGGTGGARVTSGGVDGGPFYRVTWPSATGADTAHARSDFLGPVAGTQYTSSLWVRTNVARSIRLRVLYITDGVAIYQDTLGAPVAVAANTWTRLSLTTTAPATPGAKIALAAQPTAATPAGATVDIDQSMITVGSTLQDYFDGDTPDTAYITYTWAGTPSASSSVRTPTPVQARIGEVLAASSTPAVTISQLVWNAQENPALAATLDIQDRVRAEFRGTIQDSRIVGIRHELTGKSWMITLDLIKS